MKKFMIGLIVPLAVLVVFGSFGMAEETKNELNQELNADLSDGANVRADRNDLNSNQLATDDREATLTDDVSNRGGRDLTRRGRQARRGQTATALPQELSSGDDEGGDEDEDEEPDVTPTGN